MPTSFQVEYQLLKRAVTAADSARGYPVTLFGLKQVIRDTPDAELIDAMKRLFAHGFLGLRTWDATLHGDRDYRGEQDDEAFFYGTHGFLLKQTPTSVWFLEQIGPLANRKRH